MDKLDITSGVIGKGQGGSVPPRDFWLGNFCWPGKQEARKKGKMEEKRRKIKKGKRRKIEKGKMEGGKVTKWAEKTFFFFFFLLFTFKSHWNLFWIYQNGNFILGKSISHREKNQEKWLCPLWKIFLFRPVGITCYQCTPRMLVYSLVYSSVWALANRPDRLDARWSYAGFWSEWIRSADVSDAFCRQFSNPW